MSERGVEPEPVKRNRHVPNEQRKRVAMSCDTCKAKKIKCVNPRPGPCDHCRRGKQACQITLARKQRPYYYSTEEHFKLLTALAMRSCPPETNLRDLSSLREVADQLGVNENYLGDHYEESKKTKVPGMTVINRYSGNLYLDPFGKTRFVNSSAMVDFNVRVRSLLGQGAATWRLRPFLKQSDQPQQRLENIIDAHPMEPSRSLSLQRPTLLQFFYSQLPPKAIADAHVHAFFSQVNPVSWVFQRETFDLLYEHTYIHRFEQGILHDGAGVTRDGSYQSATWICSLFGVFAVGSQFGRSEIAKEDDDAEKSLPHKANLYFALANDLLELVLDAENINAVQALLVLCLYLQNTFNYNLGWLYLGNAIRIAQLIGMHRDTGTRGTFSPTEREIRKLLWWTLYELERWLGLTGGRTVSIRDADVDAPLPDEQILPPGPHTPYGALEAYVRLARLCGQICDSIYATPRAPLFDQVALSKIGVQHQNLSSWRQALPSHLRRNLHASPSNYTRSVAMLEIRYQHAICLISRPSLYQAVREMRSQPNSTPLPELLEYADLCADAACASLNSIKYLHQHKLLHELYWPDLFFVLSLAMIFVLDFLRKGDVESGKLVQETIGILSDTNPQEGITAYALHTLKNLLIYLGLDRDQQGDAAILPHHESFALKNSVDEIAESAETEFEWMVCLNFIKQS